MALNHEAVRRAYPSVITILDTEPQTFLDANGDPVVVDSLVVAPHEADVLTEGLAEAELLWVAGELEAATQEIQKHEDADPTATSLETLWRAYRIAVRAWPDNVSFPDSLFRPTPPA